MKVKTGIKAGQQEGLGDVVAEFTQVTGLDRLAKTYEQVTGKSCGCDNRRKYLNQLAPFANQSQ
jgi:hypothetical protein